MHDKLYKIRSNSIDCVSVNARNRNKFYLCSASNPFWIRTYNYKLIANNRNLNDSQQYIGNYVFEAFCAPHPSHRRCFSFFLTCLPKIKSGNLLINQMRIEHNKQVLTHLFSTIIRTFTFLLRVCFGQFFSSRLFVKFRHDHINGLICVSWPN